jgi:hypothetical protein
MRDEWSSGSRGRQSNGQRGGRGGSSHQRGGGYSGAAHSRRDASYGIVPWMNVNGEWYFLVQMGYSSSLYNLKVDPLRGHPEPNESSLWQTAVRECMEESGNGIFCICGFARNLMRVQLCAKFDAWCVGERLQQSCSTSRASMWMTVGVPGEAFSTSGSFHPTCETLPTTTWHSCAYPLIAIATSCCGKFTAALWDRPGRRGRRKSTTT